MQTPLCCSIQDGILQITLSRDILCFAAEQHPVFWNWESGLNLRVTNVISFTQAVCDAINDEDETGATMLTRMLDKAIEQAVEEGCEGVIITPKAVEVQSIPPGRSAAW